MSDLWEALAGNIEAGGDVRAIVEIWRPLIEAEARAAAVAPLEKALASMAERVMLDGTPCFCDFDDEHHWAFCRRARALLSAPPLRPSGEPEPGGLDVERLERAMRKCGYWYWNDPVHDHAAKVAAAYDALSAATPERPAGEAGT